MPYKKTYKTHNSYKTKVISENNENKIEIINKLIKTTITRVIKQSWMKILFQVRGNSLYDRRITLRYYPLHNSVQG